MPDISLVFYQLYVKGEAFLTTNTLLKLIGIFAAIALASIVYLCFMKLSCLVSEKEGLWIICIFFLAQFALQLPTIIQPLLARRLIPFYSWLFDYIVLMNNQAHFFQIILLAFLSLLSFFIFIRVRRLETDGINPAIIRKKLLKKRRLSQLFGCFILSVVFLFVSLAKGEEHLSQAVALTPAESMTIQDEKILIPLSQVNDGHLHRFEYTTTENIKVRFIVVLKNETSYGVGLDACDICGATGYYERNDDIVCKLCDVVMNRSTIGFKGGCNPVPLAYTVEKNQMIIASSDLAAEQARFR
jgi:uncharacterized membrane protein